MNPQLNQYNNMQQSPQRHVMFLKRVVENKHKSKEQGWTCYDEKLIIRSFAASADGKLDGDFVESVASERDVQQFQAEYQAFVREHGTADGFSGTLLRYLPFLSLGRIAEWASVGVNTVEELAEAPKDIKLGSATAGEIEQAKAWLQSVKDTATVSKQAAHIAELERSLAGATQEIDELKDVIRKLNEKKDRKNGPK